MEVSHEEIIDLINTYGSGKRWQLTVSLTMLTRYPNNCKQYLYSILIR